MTVALLTALDQLQVSYSVPEKNTSDYYIKASSNSVSESNDEKATLELAEMKYIGQAFSTYIILQNGEEAWCLLISMLLMKEYCMKS